MSRGPVGAATPPGERRAHYPLLDAGRGVAAIAVLAHHLGNESGAGLAPYGYLAVDFFLLLSGFVVALAYEERLRDGLSLAAFVRLRVLRMWPMILLGSALSLVPLAIRPDPGMAPQWLLYQFFLVPAFAAWVIFPANGPLWSLFYEAVANLAHALALARLRAGVLAALLAPLAAGVAWLAVTRPDYNLGFRPEEWWIALVRILAGYLAGILLCRLLRAGRLPLPDGGPLAPLVLVALPLALPAEVPMPVVVLGAVFGCFPLAMLFGLGGSSGPGALAVARWLGGISYPLYAIHMPVVLTAKALGWTDAPARAAVFAAALLAATLAERWYDAPLRARLRRRGGVSG